MAGDGSDLHKVRAGEPLKVPATTYNTLMDVAREYRGRGIETSVPGGSGPLNPALVFIQNKSGSNVARFGILGIDTPIVDHATGADTFASRVMLNGVAPVATNHAGSFVVCLDAIANNSIGHAVIAGAVQVQINVGNTADKFADVANNDMTLLASGGSGSANILWKESGTGIKWGIVRLGGGSYKLPDGNIYTVLTKINSSQDSAFVLPLFS